MHSLTLLAPLVCAQAAPRRHCAAAASVARCLVYLGDVARYSAQAAPRAAAGKGTSTGAGAAAPAAAALGTDWARAAALYRLAGRVLPGSGHPHNQLAVMALQAGDQLAGAAHYARALAVAGQPFATARDNLLLLLEQNRARWGVRLRRKGTQGIPTQLPACVICCVCWWWRAVPKAALCAATCLSAYLPVFYSFCNTNYNTCLPAFLPSTTAML